ncbi:MAG: cation-translocating P-type ATPase [Candidatus Pacebacteria bacterium]|nr:cation-translocating P-type ATPase [Candidatus Paceibacterota bacterium]
MKKVLEKINDFSFRLWFNIFLASIIGVALMLHFLGWEFSQKIFIVFSVIGLLPVLKSAIVALIKKKLTIDLLASIALIFAFVAREWHSAAFISLMLAFARIFALWTDRKAQHILEHLLKYRPQKVKAQRNEQTIEIPAEQLVVGDLVVVESGDVIPIDGVVVSGQASVNEATITGESELIVKRQGEQVLSSTINESGSLLVKAEKIGKDSTVEKIIALITEATGKKSQSERMSDKFTTWYIIATMVGGILLFLFFKNVNLVLSVLLVTCADDIAVAVPLGFTLAIAKAAKMGVLVKGGGVIENLAKIKYFMTDKTGTLTYGKPKISQVNFFDNTDEKSFLRIVGIASINSHHPISQAAIKYLQGRNIKIELPDEFLEKPGEGIVIKKNKDNIIAGNWDFLKQSGFTSTNEQLIIFNKSKQMGFGITAYGCNGKVVGFLAFEDALRPNAREILAKTRELGVVSWCMLTGDNEKVALRVVKEVGFDNFKACLKPQDKVAFIENFKKQNKGILAMMGDGVNDAAALALADVSIAMGKGGSDASIEASDVALMKDDLKKVPQIIDFSQQAVKIIKHNFWLWGVLNAIGLFLVFVGILNPMTAALYNFLTDFLPIFNVFRISFLKKSRPIPLTYQP